MNAALLAVQMLAIEDPELVEALAAHRAEMAPPQT
jgi:phosphoribosylcarboxyaminoimidazole (NCAIR) mutase